MKKSYRNFERLSYLFLYLCLGSALGCATARKQSTVPPSSSTTGSQSQPSQPPITPTEVMGPPEPYGPPLPDQNPTYGPEPVQVKPLVVVLGPGLARGYAYIGVFRAFQDAKIPIGAIYATEMGSLIGALYAASSSVNQFEWGLLKFKDPVFREQPRFFQLERKGPSNGKNLEMLLKQVFENKDLADAKIPIKIAIQLNPTGIPIIVERGSIAKTLRAALATPSLFTPGQWTGGAEGISAASTRPFLVHEAKNLGIGPVVVINVLSDSESAFAEDELKFADLVIKPEMPDINYMDFQKMTDAAFRGKKAIHEQLHEIRRLVGLPDVDFEKRSTAP